MTVTCNDRIADRQRFNWPFTEIRQYSSAFQIAGDRSGAQFEHRAVVVCPTDCRAEQVPGGVGDQTGMRVCPVGAMKLTSVVGVLA